MSIKSDVISLHNVRTELKLLANKRKELKNKEAIIEDKISKYLDMKNIPGLKFSGWALLRERKETRETRKKKEQEDEAISVLERHKDGIEDPKEVLKEILESKKGDHVIRQKIILKKYKEN